MLHGPTVVPRGRGLNDQERIGIDKKRAGTAFVENDCRGMLDTGQTIFSVVKGCDWTLPRTLVRAAAIGRYTNEIALHELNDISTADLEIGSPVAVRIALHHMMFKAELAGVARELVRANEMEGLVQGHILIGINALHIDLVVLRVVKIVDHVAGGSTALSVDKIEIENIAALATDKIEPSPPSSMSMPDLGPTGGRHDKAKDMVAEFAW